MSNIKETYEEMGKVYCNPDWVIDYVKELEKDNGMKDHYIQILEGFIRAQSNDMAAFIVANNIKSKRVNARESQ